MRIRLAYAWVLAFAGPVALGGAIGWVLGRGEGRTVGAVVGAGLAASALVAIACFAERLAARGVGPIVPRSLGLERSFEAARRHARAHGDGVGWDRIEERREILARAIVLKGPLRKGRIILGSAALHALDEAGLRVFLREAMSALGDPSLSLRTFFCASEQIARLLLPRAWRQWMEESAEPARRPVRLAELPLALLFLGCKRWWSSHAIFPRAVLANAVPRAASHGSFDRLARWNRAWVAYDPWRAHGLVVDPREESLDLAGLPPERAPAIFHLTKA